MAKLQYNVNTEDQIRIKEQNTKIIRQNNSILWLFENNQYKIYKITDNNTKNIYNIEIKPLLETNDYALAKKTFFKNTNSQTYDYFRVILLCLQLESCLV